MTELTKEKTAESAEDSTKTRRIKTTMAELGPLLPIGFSGGGGELVRDIARRAWKTKDERALGALKKPNMNMAQYVGAVVAYMFHKMGPHTWGDDVKLDERRVVLGQMYAADVFYAWVWLRREVIGPELKLTVNCPSCSRKFVFNGDLGSLEVNKVDALSALDWTYDLKFPIEIRKKTVTRLRLQSLKWYALESAVSNNFNDALGKIVAVRGAVVGLNDDPQPIQITDSEIDEMDKVDLESLVQKLNAEFIGPKMAIEGICPHCENSFIQALDWSYNSFFSISSRS